MIFQKSKHLVWAFNGSISCKILQLTLTNDALSYLEYHPRRYFNINDWAKRGHVGHFLLIVGSKKVLFIFSKLEIHNFHMT